MSVSITTLPGDVTFVTGGANVATAIKCPPGATKCTIYFVTAPGQVTTNGADADSPINAAAGPVIADSYFVVDIAPGQDGEVPDVMVATAAGGTTVIARAEAG